MPTLPFWAGIDYVSLGNGSYYMLDSSYQVFRELSPVGDHLCGDFHEFRLTGNGTALLTIYDVVPVDLSSLNGPFSRWIYDGMFQEIEVATDKLIFEWRASEHYRVNDTFLLLGKKGRSRDDAFDFFHINSVDKDTQGNYLISARHTHTVTCIAPTVDILWILGGRANDFTDLSSGEATTFAWQHHARWRSNNIITLFDNSAYDYYLQTADYSRGIVIDLDLVNKTATLRNSHSKPRQWRSGSQGSMQQLSDDGRMLLGWGSAAAYTEFTADGEILCDVHFGAESVFGFGRTSSYRAFKGDWIGKPVTPPDIKLTDENMYVSWNGATDVMVWELQGANFVNHEDQHFELVDSVQKEGFETSFPLPYDEEYYAFLRVAALDRFGEVLGYTDVIDMATGQSTAPTKQPEDQPYSASLWVPIAGCAFVSLGFSVMTFWGPLSTLVQPHRRRGYKRMSSSEGRWLPRRTMSPGIYLTDISASASDSVVAPACRPAA